MTSPDELLFFDHAKKALESRDMYDDFLRLLNLFSKDIIDSKTLIQQAQLFLGDGDLFSQFKELMGWDERLHSVEHGPPGSIRTGPPENLSTDRIEEGQGMSYRRLPATVSGRIAFNSVL
jgi:paired amphipathic helix protein Sin3a